jgi:hypothetical protein
MVDARTEEVYETIHKVDTLNKAIRLWSEYFPNDDAEYEIVIAESSYDYMSGDKKLASLMKVGTTPGYVASS